MRKEWLKGGLIVLALVHMVLPLTLGGASYAQEKEKAAKKFKLGIMSSQTGGGAAWGLALGRAWIIEIERINAEGGVTVGGQRYEIEYVWEDSKFTGEGGATATQKLVVTHGVKYIISFETLSANLAAQPIRERARVIGIISAGTADKCLGPKHPFTFMIYPVSEARCYGIYSYLRKQRPGLERVALIPRHDEPGADQQKASLSACKKMGFDVISKDNFFEKGAVDFYPQLTKAIATKPDIIDSGIASIKEQGLMIKQAKELGYKGIIVASGAALETKVLCQLAGFEVTNVFSPTWIAGDYPILADFEKRFTGRWGMWDATAGNAFFDVSVLMDAINKAGTFETERVSKIIPTLTYKSPYGKDVLRFSGTKRYGVPHLLVTPTPTCEIIDGKEFSRGYLSSEEVIRFLELE
jgi:branched-chain amino acid transport system substrate-binding protein